MTTKNGRHFWGMPEEKEKCTPKKILAMHMRKGPHLTLGWGPRMVNPALAMRNVTCPSHKRVHCDKKEERSNQIFYTI